MHGRGESQPPRAVTASGGSGRQIVVHAATAQRLIPRAPALPLLPGDGTQPSADPLVQMAQLRRQLTEAKISPPSDQIGGEARLVIMASSEAPPRRRVRPRTRSLNRSSAAGAIRRFGTGPILQLKPRNFRRSG